MADSALSTAVNKHYLSKVMDLAEVAEVAATEDIYDARGMKLVAKGAKVSRALQEKLIVHKLKKPLESSIVVEGGVDSNLIVGAATRIIDTSAPMARILRATGTGGASPLTLLSQMQFGNAMSMMLTITERDGSQAMDHAVLVSLLSICMARKLRLSPEDQMAAGLGGLLHDIGELYIDPIYLARGKRLLPHEWAHIVVHPRIGQMLINDLESYPLSVGRAVAEHHERFDGTGYPRQAVGNNISGPGQAVSVAEMIAGVLNKDHPLERAELALKIIPGEHAHDLLSAISGALRMPLQPGAAAEQDQPAKGDDDVERLFWRITSSIEAAQELLSGPSAKSPRSKELLENTLKRIKTIQRAFISTGLDVYLNHNHGFGDGADGAILFEKAVATREIQWRLRDIARDLSLHSASPDERAIFAALIHLLDGESPAALKPETGLEAGLAALAPTSFAGSPRPAA